MKKIIRQTCVSLTRMYFSQFAAISCSFYDLQLGDKQQTCSRLHDDIYEKIKKVQGGDHIYPLIPYDDDEGEYGMIDINVDEFVDEMLGWERKEDGKGWEKTKEIPEGIREKCRLVSML